MSDPREHERRKSLRRNVVASPAALVVQGHDLGQVFVVDISAYGAYVQHPSPILPVGTEIVLRFAKTASFPATNMKARIAHRFDPGAPHRHGPGYGVEILRAENPAALDLPVTEDAVLIVEDDAALGRALSRVLGALGLGVHHETHGARALDTFEKHRRSVKLAIVDVLLPDIAGQEVIKKLRKEKPALPIIATSALFRTVSAQRPLFDAGANRFLLKPFDRDDLCKNVWSLIEAQA